VSSAEPERIAIPPLTATQLETIGFEFGTRFMPAMLARPRHPNEKTTRAS